jgi:hypothetical protein
LRVEQIERRATDVEPPHLDHHIASAQGHGHGQGHPSIVDKSGRNSVGIDVEPVLELVSGPVHTLLEVALPVKQSHTDHRQRHV